MNNNAENFKSELNLIKGDETNSKFEIKKIENSKIIIDLDKLDPNTVSDEPVKEVEPEPVKIIEPEIEEPIKKDTIELIKT